MSERNSAYPMSALGRVGRTIAPIVVILALVAGVAAVLLGRVGPPATAGSGGTGPSVEAGPASPVQVVAGSHLPPAAAGSSLAPTQSPACDVTRPDPPFVPPKPFLATPPARYESSWFGSAHLWTALHDGGDVWGPWVRLDDGLPQKTFWWSADWVPQDELEPAIMVVGRRLDAPGSFRFGPGTNASADFGTAMLVGIDIPTYGCWEITARYRAASLSFVVSVVDH